MLALLMAGQAAAGLLRPALYRDPEWIRAAWFANDLVTLCLVAPVLVAAASMSDRGSSRAELALAGALGYGVYNYAYYLLGAALNGMFPLYVLLVVLSVTLLGQRIPRLRVAAGLSRPARGARAAGFLLAGVGAGLAMVWLGMWAAHVFAGVRTPVEPEVFRLVAALDLTLMVPPMIAGGVLTFRTRPWGLVVAAAAAVQGAGYLLVLALGSAVAVRRGLVPAPGEVPLWSALVALVAALAVALLRAAVSATPAPAPTAVRAEGGHPGRPRLFST